MKREIIENEEARLNALRNLRLLDTEPSEAFDRITRLASRLLGAPVSTISLTDHDRQWFKSRFGVELAEIPRHEAPCNYAIHSDEVFLVPDLLQDERFNASLLAQAGVRFYAGAPLVTRSGYGLGTLCVIDNKPRDMPEDEQRVLVDLAAMVMTQIELQNTIGRIDPTSGYPNEHQLFEDLEDLSKRSPDQRRTALLVELVPAEQIGHGLRVLGSAYAEEFIRNSTDALRLAARGNPRFYHVGPTRSVMLLDEGESWQDLTADLQMRLREPIFSANIPVMPDPVIGVYEFQTDAASPRDVLRRLFSAADDARKGGRIVASYSELRDQAYARSFMLLSDLTQALERPGEFNLHYQPVLDFASGALAGAEALIRWRHPHLGPIVPAEFIPLVEETALTRPLTDWVLNEAIGQAARWRGRIAIPKLSINASARNLEQNDLADRVSRTLVAHGVTPQLIQLEFTETALVSYSSRSLDQLCALKEMGISIAIDDFGIGYSSLSYLQQLPASVLKIDQSFIRTLATSEYDQKLVRAVIYMAHDLGYQVVAEGIEDREAYDMLASWGCDQAQGYLIAHPLPADAMATWLAPVAT